MSTLAYSLPRFGRYRGPDLNTLVDQLLAAKQCGHDARRRRRPHPLALRILGIDESTVEHLKF